MSDFLPFLITTAIVCGAAGLFIGAAIAGGAAAAIRQENQALKRAIKSALIDATDYKPENSTGPRIISEETFRYMIKINAEQ